MKQEQLTPEQVKEYKELKAKEDEKGRLVAEYKELNKTYNKAMEQEKSLKIRLESQARRLNDMSDKLYKKYGMVV